MKNTFAVLLKTEIKLAVRGGDMLIFGIAMPAGIMLLIGYITSQQTMLNAFSGVASIGICASAFMGIPLTFAGLRYEKILKQYKPTPVSPLMLLGANCLLQFLFVLISGSLIFLIAHFLFGITPANGLRYILTFLFSTFTIFSLGFLIGSLVPDIQTANWVTTIIYFPSLFLSGATVPYTVLPDGLKSVAGFFPMTQAIHLLDNAVHGNPVKEDYIRIVIMTFTALICYLVSIKIFKWE